MALREKYDEVSLEKNYKKRCFALSAFGKQLKATMSLDAITELLTSLPEDTYNTLNKLCIARTAGCISFPKSLLAHPSQTVRFKATTMLSREDAEETFMSSQSNQQMKSWIIHSCDSLPCTARILEQTSRLFTPQLVWRVLVRTDDEPLFKAWVIKTTQLWPNSDGMLPCLDSVAAKFPDACLDLINPSYFTRQNWSWILPLARARGLKLLRRVFVEESIQLQPQDLSHKLVDWAWRHAHEDMLKICSEIFAKMKGHNSKPVLKLLTRQKNLVSSHSCPTVNRKIDTVVSVFLASPEELKSCEGASDYVRFLPDNSKGDRDAEVQKVIDAFWLIVSDLSRKTREMVFRSNLFSIFAKKVPPPAAVKQFFRMLQEVEGINYPSSPEVKVAKVKIESVAADQNIYEFMMSSVCWTEDGKFDNLMAEVFERYLSVDREGAAGFVTMFQVLLANAKTMDVIQSCFDKLSERLGSYTEKGILLEVVQRMKHLDREVRNSKKKTVKIKLPDPVLPLPVDWVHFIPELDAQLVPPYVVYMRGVLATWGNDMELLKKTMERFGTALFWDTFEHVLLHAMCSPEVLIRSPSSSYKPNFHALAGLALVAPVSSKTAGVETAEAAAGASRTCSAGSSGAAAGGAERNGKRKAKSAYFTDLDKKKQDTYGKDADRRVEGYLKLIMEASREEEQDVPKALDDLLQFIMQRFTAEQENVQFQVLQHLLERSGLPDALWMEKERMAHLQGLWKVWLKARGEGAKSSWQSIGQRLLKRALMDWPAGVAEPSEQCLFAVEMCHAGSQKASGLIDYGGLFLQLQQEMEREEPPRSLCQEAVHWMFRVAIPLPKQSIGLLVGDDASRIPLEELCRLLQRMSRAHKKTVNQRAEYDLWTKWPFVEQTWNANLECSVSLAGASFLLAGVIHHFVKRQTEVREVVEQRSGKKVFKTWWAPLEGDAYEKAVVRVFHQIECSEIPTLEGAKMLLERIEALELKERMLVDGVRSELYGKNARAWTKSEQKEWYAQPFIAPRRGQPDETIQRELVLLGKLLDRGGATLRQVQWIIMLVAAGRKGPLIDGLLRKVILSLNPRREGMARCIAKQYVYLNDALCFEDAKSMVAKLTTRRKNTGGSQGKRARKQKAKKQKKPRQAGTLTSRIDTPLDELMHVQRQAEQGGKGGKGKGKKGKKGKGGKGGKGKGRPQRRASRSPPAKYSRRGSPPRRRRSSSSTSSSPCRRGGGRGRAVSLWRRSQGWDAVPSFHGMEVDDTDRDRPRKEPGSGAGGAQSSGVAVQAQQGSFHRGTCDLLSPLLELWLHEKATRNARIDELMQRDDAECYLFFGNTFAEHLSKCRQEHLDSCFRKIRAPLEIVAAQAGAATASTASQAVEFYHHTMRVPSVARIAQLRQGWRMCNAVHDPLSFDVKCVQTSLWHPDTQRQFLQKGLQSTDMAVLGLVPRLEFVEGVEYAGELLKRHPKPQVGIVEDPGWMIIQPSGSLQTAGPWEEVERRFKEAGPPQLRNAVEDREADQLLLSLGHADHSDRALQILGAYAGKFKKAKDALMQAVPNLAPSHARRVIQDVMFKKNAGIALHIAALRLSMDLQVPDPMGLYRVAWRRGRCHRDIAASILAKVATSQTSHWTPHEVQDMFEIFDTSRAAAPAASTRVAAEAPAATRPQAAAAASGPAAGPGGTGEQGTVSATQQQQQQQQQRQQGVYLTMSAARPENLPYIVQLVLKALMQTPVWSLPFLPAIVGKLCLMPGITNDAVRALMANRNLTTEVVGAFAELLRHAQLALDARVNIAKPCPEFQLLRDLESYAKNPDQIATHLLKLPLKDCAPEMLKSFVIELLRLHSMSRSTAALANTLKVWMWLLRNVDDPSSSWRPILQEMEEAVAQRGKPEDLSALAEALSQHIQELATISLRPCHTWLPIARELYTRILKGLLAPTDPSPSKTREKTEAFKELQRTADSVREAIIRTWSDLVGKGCSEQEALALFAECPPGSRGKLALAVSTTARYTGAKVQGAVVKKPDQEALNTAKFALWWLMEKEPGLLLLNFLSQEWPKVLQHDDAREQTLPPLLKFFEQFHKEGKKELVVFVNGMFECKLPRLLCLQAVRWLGGLHPREAIVIWPKLLPEHTVTDRDVAKAVADDIGELFALCIKHSLEPPELKVKACSAPEVLALLVKTELPRGRLMAVLALQERDLQDKDKDLAATLNALRSDPCVIVKAAAQVAWASFFGEEEDKKRQAAAPADAEPQEEEWEEVEMEEADRDGEGHAPMVTEDGYGDGSEGDVAMATDDA